MTKYPPDFITFITFQGQLVVGTVISESHIWEGVKSEIVGVITQTYPYIHVTYTGDDSCKCDFTWGYVTQVTPFKVLLSSKE